VPPELPRKQRTGTEILERNQEIERKKRDIERKKAMIEAQIMALRTEFEVEKEELERAIAGDNLYQEVLAEETQAMARARKADSLASAKKKAAETRNTGKRGGE
jgi:circadian clock protein KaiC